METVMANTKRLIKQLPHPVYYIESPDDETVLVGIHITIEQTRRITTNQAQSTAIKQDQQTHPNPLFQISWYDTTRERTMIITDFKQAGDIFTFRRILYEGEDGGFYRLTPLTLEIYNTKVKHFLFAGTNFKTNEELTEAFLLTTKDVF